MGVHVVIIILYREEMENMPEGHRNKEQEAESLLVSFRAQVRDLKDAPDLFWTISAGAVTCDA